MKGSQGPKPGICHQIWFLFLSEQVCVQTCQEPFSTAEKKGIFFSHPSLFCYTQIVFLSREQIKKRRDQTNLQSIFVPLPFPLKLIIRHCLQIRPGNSEVCTLCTTMSDISAFFKSTCVVGPLPHCIPSSAEKKSCKYVPLSSHSRASHRRRKMESEEIHLGTASSIDWSRGSQQGLDLERRRGRRHTSPLRIIPSPDLFLK